MSKVSLKGVLIGGVVDMVASVVLGLPFALYDVEGGSVPYAKYTGIGSSDGGDLRECAAIRGSVTRRLGLFGVGRLRGGLARWSVDVHPTL